MGDYGILPMDSSGNIAKRCEADCASDEDACLVAWSMLTPDAPVAQVWCGFRRVGEVYRRFPASKPRRPPGPGGKKLWRSIAQGAGFVTQAASPHAQNAPSVVELIPGEAPRRG